MWSGGGVGVSLTPYAMDGRFGGILLIATPENTSAPQGLLFNVYQDFFFIGVSFQSLRPAFLLFLKTQLCSTIS